MASSKEYKDFIFGSIILFKSITKTNDGRVFDLRRWYLFWWSFDDRLLVKITKTNSKYQLQKELPYENAKPMYLVENVDDKDYLQQLVIDTIKGLG